MNRQFWWPFHLSQKEEQALDYYRQGLLATSQSFPIERTRVVSEKLAAAVGPFVGEILERDGLPHHCHVVVGWGNAVFGGRRILDDLPRFAHRRLGGEFSILQCDPEGEFHPWQTFAYAVMAGVDPDEPCGRAGLTLRSLAKASRHLNTSEGRELGHLLFALAHLDPDRDTAPFVLGDRSYTLDGLVNLAIEAHQWGTFEVCRKFHLTEGICAAASRIEGLESLREVAQHFLDGQLEILLLFGLLLSEIQKESLEQSPARACLVKTIRQSLVLGDYLENHLFYAGHLVEMAGFASSLGYQIKAEHQAAIAAIVSHVNETLEVYLPHLSIPDCFLQLAHYRRAITLIMELQSAAAPITNHALSRYSVNFDCIDSILPQETSPREFGADGVYETISSSAAPRSRFAAILHHYAAFAATGFELRGNFDHFRRICPPGWPRALHYEFLDYSDAVGAEIHVESDAVATMSSSVRDLTANVAEAFESEFVEWEEGWYRGRGRLRVVFTGPQEPKAVAYAMVTLIRLTFQSLDTEARHIAVIEK